MSNKIKMVQVKLPSTMACDLLYERIEELLKSTYEAESFTTVGYCYIRERDSGVIVCSTDYPKGKRAKPYSYGELLVTLPSFVLKDDVEYTEV